MSHNEQEGRGVGVKKIMGRTTKDEVCLGVAGGSKAYAC